MKQKTAEAGKPRTLAYLRVSTADQDLEKFKTDILQFTNKRDFGKVLFHEEKVSGRKPWRERKLGRLIDNLHKGDRLIVPELSRLGRSMLEIMEILSLVRDKGASVYAVKGNWSLNSSIESKIIGMVFAMAAEIERDLISQRTKEALKARKMAGVKLGRPRGPGKSKLDQHGEEIIALLRNGATKTHVASKYGTTTVNLYNWLKKKTVDCSPVSD